MSMRGAYLPPVIPVAVRIGLSDGAVLTGKLEVRTGKTLAEALNSPSMFVELVALTGEQIFLTKAQILSVAVLDTPKRPELVDIVNDSDFDPYSILDVARGSTPDEVRHAYLRTTKKYHPDRFASMELPDEVNRYLGAMARRVNAAYALIESQFASAH